MLGRRADVASAQAQSDPTLMFKNIPHIVGEQTDFDANAASYLSGTAVGLALTLGTIEHRRRAARRR